MARVFEATSFAERSASVDAFAAAVLARLPPDARRVLDVGCGTGELARRLIAGRPDLTVVGIDISSRNIALAHARQRVRQVEFVCADYMTFDGGCFDALLGDSVFHLIHADDGVLVAKIARDLLPNGQLIATLPVASKRNLLLIQQRRLFPPPRWLDRPAARLLAPLLCENEAVLQDRIGYLRIIPERLLGPALKGLIASSGFHLVEQVKWPGKLLKPAHALVTYRKIEAG